MTTAKHKHECAAVGPDSCYSGRVPDAGAAAGWVEYWERCACGAQRWVAANYRRIAHSEWAPLDVEALVEGDRIEANEDGISTGLSPDTIGTLSRSLRRHGLRLARQDDGGLLVERIPREWQPFRAW